MWCYRPSVSVVLKLPVYWPSRLHSHINAYLLLPSFRTLSSWPLDTVKSINNAEYTLLDANDNIVFWNGSQNCNLQGKNNMHRRLLRMGGEPVCCKIAACCQIANSSFKTQTSASLLATSCLSIAAAFVASGGGYIQNLRCQTHWLNR